MVRFQKVKETFTIKDDTLVTDRVVRQSTAQLKAPGLKPNLRDCVCAQKIVN